jgi:hypothetical protein
MDPQIRLLMPLRLLLLTHVRLMLVINEFDDGHPGVTVVDVVAKTGGVNDGELDLELFLFEFSLDDFDLSQLVKLLVVPPIVIFWRGELS